MSRRIDYDVEIIERRPHRVRVQVPEDGTTEDAVRGALEQVSAEDEQAMRDRGFEVTRVERAR